MNLTTSNVDSTPSGTQPTAAYSKNSSLLNLPGEIGNLSYDQIFDTQDHAHTSRASRLISRQLRLQYEAQALKKMRLHIHSFAVEAFRLTGLRLGFSLPSSYCDIFSIHFMLPLTYLLELESSPLDLIELSITMSFCLQSRLSCKL